MTTIQENIFGKLPNQKKVSIFTLKNRNGIRVQILNYGGIIHSIKTPDRNGKCQEITIGYDHLDQYISCNQYFGALIGRYANRINGATFNIDGKVYNLVHNDGRHHLHGGNSGFDQKLWEAKVIDHENAPSLKLWYHSPDMEEGYPGNLDVSVEYCLTDDNALILSYSAVSDKKTPVNLTSHTYFNLTGNCQNSILNHSLSLNSDNFTPIDSECIPTGEILEVNGTPLDFRKPCSIGQRINNSHPQIETGNGYDHNFILNPDTLLEKAAATVIEPKSGRKMELFCTQPGLQFYSGNSLDEEQLGKNNNPIKVRHGLCLEPQHFPDSPNKPQFPSTILEPGKTYSHQIKFKFSVIS